MSDVESERNNADSNDVADSENEEGSDEEGSGPEDSEEDAESGEDNVDGEDAGGQLDGAPWDSEVTESEQRSNGCGRANTQSEVRMLLKSLLRQVQG